MVENDIITKEISENRIVATPETISATFKDEIYATNQVIPATPNVATNISKPFSATSEVYATLRDGIVATSETELGNIVGDILRGNNSKNVATKRGRGRPKSTRWRLDFVADINDKGTTIRARLRRASGKDRSNPENYIKLGKVEDVYYDRRYRHWKRRCERYCASIGYKIKDQPSGERHSNVISPPNTGVAGLEIDKWGDLEIYQLPRSD